MKKKCIVMQLCYHLHLNLANKDLPAGKKKGCEKSIKTNLIS